MNVGEELVALGHATYPFIEQATSETTSEETKDSQCPDEGISMPEDVNNVKSNIDNVVEDLVNDVVDRSMGSSFDGIQNCNEHVVIKPNSITKQDIASVADTNISPVEALKETPIRIMSNNSTSWQ